MYHKKKTKNNILLVKCQLQHSLVAILVVDYANVKIVGAYVAI